SGNYRLGFDVGSDAKRIWGVNTANFRGIDLGLKLKSEAPYLFKGAYFMVLAELFRFVTRFSGQTACRSEPCGTTQTNTPDLWEPWPFEGELANVTGGLKKPVHDNYLRLVAGFGFELK